MKCVLCARISWLLRWLVTDLLIITNSITYRYVVRWFEGSTKFHPDLHRVQASGMLSSSYNIEY